MEIGEGWERERRKMPRAHRQEREGQEWEHPKILACVGSCSSEDNMVKVQNKESVLSKSPAIRPISFVTKWAEHYAINIRTLSQFII